MHSNIAVTKKMITYAKDHDITIPRMIVSSPTWGTGKRTLAWRVSGHIHGRTSGKWVPQSAQKTWQLDRWFWPLTPGQKILKKAKGELGVTEVPAGSNSGPRVAMYQAQTGMYRQPWCASFVKWCVISAGLKLPAFAHAWVPAWAANRDTGNLDSVTRINLRPGDIVCLWHSAHIEIFEKWIVKGVLAQCIGGNTSPVGKNANGGMVARTRRYTTEMNAQMRVRG